MPVDAHQNLAKSSLGYQRCLVPWVATAWSVPRSVPHCMQPSAWQGDEGRLPFSQVLDAYPDLLQHLLSCLSTNHLCPAATEVYKALVRQQRAEWQDGHRDAESALAERWALCWLPLLSQALRSPLPILQSNAANHLLAWTLRQLPATQALLAARFGGQDTASLRAWVSLLKAQKSVAGALPLQGEALERLSCCLGAREEGIRLAALGLLCCSPSTNRPLSGTEVRLLQEFLPLNLNCDSSSFRQLLQAAVRKALVRLRDSSLAQLRGKVPRGTEPGEGVGQLAQAVGEVATAAPPSQPWGIRTWVPGPASLVATLCPQALWSGCCSSASPRSAQAPTTRGRRRLCSFWLLFWRPAQTPGAPRGKKASPHVSTGSLPGASPLGCGGAPR